MTDDQLLQALAKQAKGEMFGWAISQRDLPLAKRLTELGPVATPTLEQLILLILEEDSSVAPLLRLVIRHTEFVQLYCRHELSDGFPEDVLKRNFKEPARLNKAIRSELYEAGCLDGARTLAQAQAELAQRPLENNFESAMRMEELLELGLPWDQADPLMTIFGDTGRQYIWIGHMRSLIFSRGLREQDYDGLIARIGDINALYQDRLPVWLVTSLYIVDDQYLPFFERLVSSGIQLNQRYQGQDWQEFFDGYDGKNAETKEALKQMIEKAWIRHD